MRSRSTSRRVAYPIVWFLQVSANVVLRPLRVKPAPAGMIAYTREDIRHSVAAAEDVGEFQEAEEEMLYIMPQSRMARKSDSSFAGGLPKLRLRH